MKKIFTLFAFMIISISGFSQATETFHDFYSNTIYGDSLNFSTFYGRKVMVVNTASFCGYTPQFTQLEELYTQYQDSNFVIIGFPCNDFGSQDPHGDSIINEFCTANYGITFQMMSKVKIITGDTAEVYKWLQIGSRNGVQDVHVSWNFNKFLIDEAGHWVNHFPEQTLPTDTAITNWIKSPSVIVEPTSVKNIAADIFHSTQTNDKLILTLNVASKNITVNIYSVSGQLLSTVTMDNSLKGSTIEFDTNSIHNGIYFLNIQSDKQSQTQKFVVLK